MSSHVESSRSILLHNLTRIAKYVLTRAVTLFITVAVTVFLMIVIANYGGYLDKAIKADIDYAIGMSMKGLEGTTEERAEIFEQLKEAAYDAAGLNTPFIVRCFRWLGRGLTLDWGETNLRADRWARSRPMREVVLDNLPRSLMIFGAGNLLLFFTTVLVALPMARRRAGWLDNLIILLTPLSSAPAWVYGIFLNFIFLKLVGGTFAGGAFDAWPGDLQWSHLPILLRHMLLPTLAIFLSGFFQGVYTWRTFFLLYAREHYVVLATAKGLRAGVLRRRYILRPLLPSLLTSFVLLFVSLWQEVIVLEQFFNVSGIGKLFVAAVTFHDIPMIVALVTTFAYLLAVTVFFLDIVYVIVDPRIQLENQSVRVKPARRTSWLRRLWRGLRRSRNAQAGDALVTMSEAPGIKMLDRILQDFQRRDDVSLERSGASGHVCRVQVDRFYPELNIAVQFAPSATSDKGGKSRRCREAGIVLITVPPDQPLAPSTLRRLEAGLSSAARRIAQRVESVHTRRKLIPRIASAREACRRMFKEASGSRQRPKVRPANVLRRWKEWLARLMSSVGLFARRLSHYPAALVGLLIILSLVGVSVYTLITIPYPKMLRLWREGEDRWVHNPKDAAPSWVNLFRKRKLPSTVLMDSRATDSAVQVSRTAVSEEMTEVTLSFPFDSYYGAFPQDLAVFIDAQYDEKRPLITLNWFTPDGREIEFMSAAIGDSHTYRLSQDETLARRLGEQAPLAFLFSQPESNGEMPLSGSYEMQISTYLFEEGADVDATFVLYGQVYGWAGTDERRRDLKIPLLWGLPIALSFGILAALGTSLSSIMIAAVGAWFGGWVDALIQRVTEVNMILPFLPVSIMIYVLYSKSFWMILGVTVLLSIFGNAIKNYRALFLQVREAPYVEAALSYGASNWRIISRYMIPRVISVLVPQLIIMVPSYVFLEASLAFLGVSDPVLPTWGKLIVSGFARGIYTTNYHLIFEPLGMLMLVGFAFVLLGISLERLFNVGRFAR